MSASAPAARRSNSRKPDGDCQYPEEAGRPAARPTWSDDRELYNTAAELTRLLDYRNADLFFNSDGAFYLQGGASNPYNIPLGGLLPYIGSSAPNSAFALPYGQAISRTAYATLFTLVGTTFGSGDGSTTFNVPDLRGRVFAGLDNMGGSSASRLSSAFASTAMGNTGGAQSQTIAQANIPNYNLNIINFNDPGHGHTVNLTSPFTFNPVGSSSPFGNALYSSGGSGIAGAGAALAATTGITFQVNSGGSGAALTTTQPTIVVNFILRII